MLEAAAPQASTRSIGDCAMLSEPVKQTSACFVIQIPQSNAPEPFAIISTTYLKSNFCFVGQPNGSIMSSPLLKDLQQLRSTLVDALEEAKQTEALNALVSTNKPQINSSEEDFEVHMGISTHGDCR